MFESDEEWNVAQLYGVLMRPPMWLGLPYDYLPIMFFGMALLLVVFNPVVGLLSFVPLWVIGYFTAKADPDGFSVFRYYFQTFQTDCKLNRGEGAAIYGAF